MPPPAIRRTLAAVVAVLLPHSALAQLEEIIVTAQKRAESAQDVPIAVTAFDAAALKSQQISTFGDMRFAAPNVSYAKGNFTSNNFATRWVSRPAARWTSPSTAMVKWCCTRPPACAARRTKRRPTASTPRAARPTCPGARKN